MWRQRVTPAAPDRWGLRPSGILTLPSFEGARPVRRSTGAMGLLREVQLPRPESQPRGVVSRLLRAPDVVASQDTGGAGFPGARVVARLAGRGGLGCLGGAWRALHEGRGLLGRGRGYSMRCEGSCSTHNPWSVRPYPRAAGRPEEGARAKASVEAVPPGPCAEVRRGQIGADRDRASRSAAKVPDAITRATRCPHSRHWHPSHRHTRRGSPEFCGSTSAGDGA